MNMVTFTTMNLMAGIPGFFRQKRPRQFVYKPLFYDQRKEAREERLKKYGEGTDKDDALHYTPSLRKGSFKDYHRSSRRNVHTGSNIRLFVIILLLGLLTYFLLLS